MGFTLDNQVLFYIIIVMFIVQFVIMRYYINSSIEDNMQKNNKKIIKKLSTQIGVTFDTYMGNYAKGHVMRRSRESEPRHELVQDSSHDIRSKGNRQIDHDADSIDDPVDNDDNPDIREHLDRDEESDMQIN